MYMVTNLPDVDVLELRGEGEDSEQLYLTEGGLQHLVVGGHGLVGQVVVRGDATQLCHLPRWGGGMGVAWTENEYTVEIVSYSTPSLFLCTTVRSGMELRLYMYIYM